MFVAADLNRFFNFLPIDWESLWSFFGVNKPSRPITAQERARRFHYVTVDGTIPVRPDDAMGQVYLTQDNKVVYWDNEDGDRAARNARYVSISAEDILKSGQSGAVSWSSTRVLGEKIDAEDRQQLLRDYYGDQKGQALIATLALV